MAAFHSSGTTQALYRIFVQPCLKTTSSLARAPLRATLQRAHSRLSSRRCYSKYRAPVQRKQAYDEEIGVRYVHLVDEQGTFHPPQPLVSILRSFDRTTHHLVQVSPPNLDDPNHVPTCKILSKQSLREAERARTKPKKTPQDMTKQLELNWAISGNDLGHRMKRMLEFLEQGRRVDVVLMNKKGGRKASAEECKELVQKVRQTAKEVSGVKEWKGEEGKLGGQLLLYFEGKAKDKEKPNAKNKTTLKTEAC